jgi:hypothetical protein
VYLTWHAIPHPVRQVFPLGDATLSQVAQRPDPERTRVWVFYEGGPPPAGSPDALAIATLTGGAAATDEVNFQGVTLRLYDVRRSP